MLRNGKNRSAVSLFLACVVVRANREISRRRLKRLAGMSALAAVYLLLSGRPAIQTSDSAAYAFFRNYYAKNNDEPEAQEAFARAYRLDPNKIEAIRWVKRALVEVQGEPELARCSRSRRARRDGIAQLRVNQGLKATFPARTPKAGSTYRATSSRLRRNSAKSTTWIA
jgi:hypothetical protein